MVKVLDQLKQAKLKIEMEELENKKGGMVRRSLLLRMERGKY